MKYTAEIDIPDNLDLTLALPTLHDPNDPSQAFALDLQQEVLPNSRQTLLQQVQDLPLFSTVGARVQQIASGTLEICLGSDIYALSPVSVFKDAYEPVGISFTQDGQVKFVTNSQCAILLNGAVHERAVFNEALGKTIQGSRCYCNNANGSLVLTTADSLADAPYYCVRPAIKTSVMAAESPSGLYSLPYLPQQFADLQVLHLLYATNRQQTILPMPAYWESLKQGLQALNFTNITLQTDGIIKLTSLDGKFIQAIMGYQVTPSKQTASEVSFAMVNASTVHGLQDLEVTYPNGDKQRLILLSK